LGRQVAFSFGIAAVRFFGLASGYILVEEGLVALARDMIRYLPGPSRPQTAPAGILVLRGLMSRAGRAGSCPEKCRFRQTSPRFGFSDVGKVRAAMPFPFLRFPQGPFGRRRSVDLMGPMEARIGHDARFVTFVINELVEAASTLCSTEAK